MKYLWIGVVILAVVLVLCICVNSVLNGYTAQVQGDLTAAMDAARSGNYKNAAERAKKAADAWETHLHFYASVLCHDETDEITAGFAELQVVEEAEFLQTASMLESRLTHISEMDLPLLHNIL